MTWYSSTVDTPVGPFTVLATDDAVLASGWPAGTNPTGTNPTGTDALASLIHPALKPAGALFFRYAEQQRNRFAPGAIGLRQALANGGDRHVNEF